MTQKSILEYFSYQHLPAHLQDISKPFCDLARLVESTGNDPRETAVALRKLLEAKDAAVRSAL
jgi:hypothetical protein